MPPLGVRRQLADHDGSDREGDERHPVVRVFEAEADRRHEVVRETKGGTGGREKRGPGSPGTGDQKDRKEQDRRRRSRRDGGQSPEHAHDRRDDDHRPHVGAHAAPAGTREHGFDLIIGAACSSTSLQLS